METSRNITIIKITLFIVFIFSGFSGLIYESIWTHYLKLLLGHAAYAQTLVLAIFMAGMGLGAFIISTKTAKIKHPLKAYVVVELLIGGAGCFFHPVFLATESWLLDSMLPSLGSAELIITVKWIVSGALILPQSILLGMTFPLMSAAIIRLDQKKSGTTLSLLYFSNSIGAVIGVLASGFILIAVIGLPGTIFTAAIINIILACLVWVISSNVEDNDIPPIPKTETGLPAIIGIMLLTSFLTGFSSFFYEIGWIRMLSQVLGSSTHAFELMLSAFILGLALGSLWIKRKIDSFKHPVKVVAIVQIIMGLMAALTLPLYNESFDYMEFLLNALKQNENGYLLFNIGSHLIAMLIMLPATFMAGMTLPLITLIVINKGRGEKGIGQVYAANTFGAIAGIYLSLHIAMPIIGTKGIILTGVFIDIALGISILAFYSKGLWMRYNLIWMLLSTSVMILVFVFVNFDPYKMNAGVYQHGHSQLSKQIEFDFYQEGKTATVSVLNYKNKQVSITTNGKTDAMLRLDHDYSADEVTMTLTGAIALLHSPNAKTVANIGIGSGMTTSTLLLSDTIKQVDTVEIEAEMVLGAKLMGPKVQSAFSDPRSIIHIDDAKSFFATYNKKFDIIVSEPSNPWISGIASLFSDEFYNRIKKYLNDDGFFAQWLQLYDSNLTNISSVLKAIDKNFNHYSVYFTDGSNLIILATDKNNYDFKINEIKPLTLIPELARIGINNIEDINIRKIDKMTLKHLMHLNDSPINSDYYPFLSLNAPKSFFYNQLAKLIYLKLTPVPIFEIINQETTKWSEFNSKQKYFPLTKIRNIATELLKEKVSYKELPEIVALSHSIINNFNNRCTHDINDDELRLLKKSYYYLASNINAFTTQQESKIFWNKILKKECNQYLSQKLQSWLNFHYSISQRDSKNILLHGHNLHDNSLSTNETLYFMSAMLSSYIATKKIEAARSFIIQYKLIDNFDSLPLHIKILMSMILNNYD